MSKNKDYTRDPDVLDTWFSSALWPFATLGFDLGAKKQSDLFEKFYSAQMLETGHDIIFFWVIRMLLFWYEFTGETPFEKIYLHGLIKDKQGRKMSKTLGNGIDPLEMIEKHWTDALRLSMTIGNTPGNDLKLDVETIKSNKVFINKLWNASRFVQVNLQKSYPELASESKTTTIFDIEKIEKELIKDYDKLMFHEKWILSKISHLSDLVTKSMDSYNFSEAGQELYYFTKNEFCDYYIEEFKLTKERSKYGEKVIIYTINHLLKLWHPYIPFVTEEIYSKLGLPGELIDGAWSEVKLERNEQIEKDKVLVMDLIREVRKLRAENNIMPNKTIKLKIYAKNKNAEILGEALDLIAGIVKSEETEIIDKKLQDQNLVYSVIKSGVEVYVDTSNALDVEKEHERMKEQIDDIKLYISILDKKLLNENFVRNAPKALVIEEMTKKQQSQERLEKLEEKFKNLN